MAPHLLKFALAWLLGKNPWIERLFGTRELERFKDNIGAPSVKLTQDDLDAIEAANIQIRGARCPEDVLRRSSL